MVMSSGLYPWKNPDWCHHQDEDEQDRCGETRLSPLREEVQQVREETQEHVCPSLSLLQRRQCWRRCHRRRVQVRPHIN